MGNHVLGTSDQKRRQEIIDLAAHARAYLRRGWKIVPLWWIDKPESVSTETGEVTPGVCGCPRGNRCSSPGKHPHTQHGTKKPLKSGLEIDLYWAQNPRCNIGIATGTTSGLVVLDVDVEKGGDASVRKIFDRYSPPGRTPISVTGSGGRHILYGHPGQPIRNAIGYMPGIDVRADGGLIVAPPSMHVTGVRYRWHPSAHPRYCPLEPMPDWMAVFCHANDLKRRVRNRAYGAGRRGGQFEPGRVPPISNGQRNNTLCSIAGRLLWERRSDEEVMRIVNEINKSKCDPPLAQREVDKLLHHACRRWGDRGANG